MSMRLFFFFFVSFVMILVASCLCGVFASHCSCCAIACSHLIISSRKTVTLNRGFLPEGFLGLLCLFDRPHPFMALMIALVVL